MLPVSSSSMRLMLLAVKEEEEVRVLRRLAACLSTFESVA